MRILGVIQARTGSHRLPGKVLMPILGKPMLWHIVERVKRSTLLSDFIIACPMKDMTEFGKLGLDCKVYANADIKENDLVRRFYDCAEGFGADIVVRMCADNVCIDPINIDGLISEYGRGQRDAKKMGTNAGDSPQSSWPMSLGAEIYSTDLITWLNDSIQDPWNLIPNDQDPEKVKEAALRFREHPHTLLHDNFEFWEPDCPYEWKSPLKFSVDTQAEFYRAESIYKHFGRNTFTTEELLAEEALREEA